jgi:hypothetical protein
VNFCVLPWLKWVFSSCLSFFRERNGNSDYSEKLNTAFALAAGQIEDNPLIGMKHNGDENVRSVLVMRTYRLFYKIREIEISILKVWDVRRNPDDLYF